MPPREREPCLVNREPGSGLSTARKLRHFETLTRLLGTAGEVLPETVLPLTSWRPSWWRHLPAGDTVPPAQGHRCEWGHTDASLPAGRATAGPEAGAWGGEESPTGLSF